MSAAFKASQGLNEQTVAEFVSQPINPLIPINEAVPAECYPKWGILGLFRPPLQQGYYPTIADVTDIPNPICSLWRRPFNRLVR